MKCKICGGEIVKWLSHNVICEGCYRRKRQEENDLIAAHQSLRDCGRRALTLWERWSDRNDKSASVQSNEFTRQVDAVVNDARLARRKIEELEGKI